MPSNRDWTKIGLGLEIIAGVIVAIEPLLAIPVAIGGGVAIAWGLYPNQIGNSVSRLSRGRIGIGKIDDPEPRLQIEALNAPDYRRMNFQSSRRDYVCGIAVRNTSATQEIEGVTVRITRFDDGSLDIFDAPQTVNPKRLPINAGISQPWEIARGSHVDLDEVVDLSFNISYHGGPYRTPLTPINLTIEASGAGTGAVTRDFVLRSDEHCRPMLIPVDEIENVERLAAERDWNLSQAYDWWASTTGGVGEFSSELEQAAHEARVRIWGRNCHFEEAIFEEVPCTHWRRSRIDMHEAIFSSSEGVDDEYILENSQTQKRSIHGINLVQYRNLMVSSREIKELWPAENT